MFSSAAQSKLVEAFWAADHGVARHTSNGTRDRVPCIAITASNCVTMEDQEIEIAVRMHKRQSRPVTQRHLAIESLTQDCSIAAVVALPGSGRIELGESRRPKLLANRCHLNNSKSDLARRSDRPSCPWDLLPSCGDTTFAWLRTYTDNCLEICTCT